MNSEAGHWIGLDIGGANIKIADNCGSSRSVVFPLWQQPQKLSDVLRVLIAEFSRQHSAIAVTMTGELADCFENKREGVAAIVDAAVAAAADHPVRFYTTNGTFIDADAAKRNFLRVAAANWHALTSCICNLENTKTAPDSAGILLDIGSTTTDLIPFQGGAPKSKGLTDTQRLIAGELVYTGVVRTPLCSLIDHATFDGQRCPLARELFATALDCYLMLGDIAESKQEDSRVATADGQPATKQAAIRRLGRMICADNESFSTADALSISCQTRTAQISLLSDAIMQVADAMSIKPSLIVTSGQGEFLAASVIENTMPDVKQLSLSSLLTEGLSRCAPAYAVAMLAARSQTSG